MSVELLIQHGKTIQYPVVEEGAQVSWERKGTPGKLNFAVVCASGLNFQEGDPVRWRPLLLRVRIHQKANA